MEHNQRSISLGFDSEPYPAGTHMCLIFDDEDERRWVMARYVESGLEGGEQVGYYVDAQTPDQLKQSMRELGVALPEELDGRQYRFFDAVKGYCPDGTFKVDRMLDLTAGALDHSLEDGYDGARLTGEMSWALKGYPGSDGLIEYESRINLLLRTVPVTTLCQYDAGRFDGATLYGVLRVHPMMVVHGQVLRNPNYVEPEVFLASGGGGGVSGGAGAGGAGR